MTINWRETTVSEDETHHLWKEKPLYSKRFVSVLKFHSPGLAPVLDESGAYHINIRGESLCPQRYFRTFGFYEGKAAIESGDGGWFHISSDGSRLYPEHYRWCGNFQGDHCTVRDTSGRYFHLNNHGKPAYAARWRYAGDFRDGMAVVQNDEGMHSHIHPDGELIHQKWFPDLDVFHKGLARARDKEGWFHVNRNGTPVYERRFNQVEPFYNGQARVETSDGALRIINEHGKTLIRLRSSQQDPLHTVSRDIVGYWRTYTIYAAVQLKIFDALPNAIPQIAGKSSLSEDSAKRILRALWEMNLIHYDGETKVYSNLAGGELLKRNEAYSLAPASISFTETHVSSWELLAASLQTGKSAFLGCKDKDWFQNLYQNQDYMKEYQKAMDTYALHDYREIAGFIDGGKHRKVIDAGGGKGTVIKNLLTAYPRLCGILLERPEVVGQVSVPQELADRFTVKSFDLFSPWPESGDAVILARVLHDWDDEHALRILKFAKESLSSDGTLYLFELLLSEESPDGGLLDLNMLATTGGRERSYEAFSELLASAGFVVYEKHSLSSVVNLIITGLRK